MKNETTIPFKPIGYREIAESHPKLVRGQVWCRACGHTEKVDSAHALRHGWLKHCGYTMTIDPPEEW